MDTYDKILSRGERINLCMKYHDKLEFYFLCRKLSDIDRPFMRGQLSVKVDENLLTKAININDHYPSKY